MINIFFVDDPKLCASYINILKKQLDLVTTFSKDTRIPIGAGNCEQQQVEYGKLNKNTEDQKMNNGNIKLIKDGDTYKYLGIDANTSYAGAVNKERVMKESLTKVKKIRLSELSFFNKFIIHNILSTDNQVIDPNSLLDI